jgi:predicted nucleotidyltransferase
MEREKLNIPFNSFKKTLLILAESNVSFYIFGGFSIDGLVGKITRPHGDIDIFAWKKDKENIINILKNKDYCIVEEGVIITFSKEEVKGDILFIEERDNLIYLYGNKATCTIPKAIFEKSLYGNIQGFSFPMMPLEWTYAFLQYSCEHDKKILTSLGYNPKGSSQIKTIEVYKSHP